MPSTPRLSIAFPTNASDYEGPVDLAALVSPIIDTFMTYFVIQSTQPSGLPDGSIWWCDDRTSDSFGANWYDGTEWTAVDTAKVYVGTGAPSSPYPNLLWLNPSTLVLQYYTGGAWVSVAPEVALSQIATSSGNDGQVLYTVDGVAAWQPAPFWSAQSASYPAPQTASDSVLSASGQPTVTGTGFTNYELKLSGVVINNDSANHAMQVQISINGTPLTPTFAFDIANNSSAWHIPFSIIVPLGGQTPADNVVVTVSMKWGGTNGSFYNTLILTGIS